VPLGTGYTVTEGTLPSGWDFVSIDCSASSGVSVPPANISGKTVTFDLDASTDVLDCTYTNKARGSLKVVKQDDDDPANRINGVTFTLFNDLGTIGGTRQATNIDTPTGKSCTTAAVVENNVTINGTCSISDIVPGEYWLVETTPSGYASSPDQHVTITAGSNATYTFTNPRLFKVITFICQESDNSLYAGTVDLGTTTGVATQTTQPFAGQNICTIAGARFTGLQYGNHSSTVHIPQ
jgi:hypothetical protein